MTIFVFLTGTPAFAADAPKPFLTAEQLAPHRATIARVENYLSGLTTIVADFTQVAPDGGLAGGKFYLKRPGQMRWQYDPPTPILMVANGKTLVFYDYELQQVTHIPLDETVIGFLARRQIDFSDTVGIRSIEEEHGIIRIALAQRDRPDEGELTLELSDKPLQIKNMVVTDGTGQTTTVSLNHARYGVALDKELFIFRDPRPKRVN